VRARGVRVALFTGCIMEPLFGRVNRATLQVLLANGFEVVVPREQRCCGALLVHAGRPDRARELARANVAAFGDADVVVNNSAGCGCALAEYGHLLGDASGAAFAAKCRDVSAFLAAAGLSATPAPCHERAAYDDPCHLCHGQGVRSQPRELLAQVPGLELVAHQAPEDCCGSAGIYNLLQPGLAARIGRRKAESLARTGVGLVLTGNPGCMLQIDSHLRQVGHKARVRHPIELLLPPP
jgi:glycolate oxidase iron-sulfur subunit